MASKKAKQLLYGTLIAGSIFAAARGCSSNKDDQSAPKTETTANKVTETNDPYGNVALFEATRSKIKFALAFAENYYPYTYWCGEAWTTGHGLTILYNADGSYKTVKQNTKVPTIEESDVYKGRYLTHEILKDIKRYVTVPMDENTMIAACVLRYCIGGKNFKNSAFLKQLNAGVTGEKLAKTMTGWRQQHGVPNRCYFFAALMSGKMKYSELLDLRAEGCYNLDWQDIFVYNGKNPKKDANGFYEWDYSKLQANLAKAKLDRNVPLNLGGKKHVVVKCKMVKDIVPKYIWDEVSSGKSKHNKANNTITVVTPETTNEKSDKSYIAYQKGDYKTALKAGKEALALAETDKQKGAAYYNIGISYLALGNYDKAVKFLNKSLKINKTSAAERKLQEALAQRKANGNKKAIPVAAVAAAGFGVALYARKKYLMQRKKRQR